MVTQIISLFGLLGLDLLPPATVGEFFPWFFQVLMAFCLVAGFLQFLRWVCGMMTKGAGGL